MAASLSLGALSITALLSLYAAWIDSREMIIPNWVSIAIVGAFAVRWYYAPESVSFPADILLGVGMFFTSALLFQTRILGGGDLKLITALGLWFGTTHTVEFLIWTGIFGGLLSLVIVIVTYLDRLGILHPKMMFEALMPAMRREKSHKIGRAHV